MGHSAQAREEVELEAEAGRHWHWGSAWHSRLFVSFDRPKVGSVIVRCLYDILAVRMSGREGEGGGVGKSAASSGRREGALMDVRL